MKKIALLSNVTVDSLRNRLEEKGIPGVYCAEGYGSWVEHLLPGGKLFEQPPDGVIVLLDGSALLEQHGEENLPGFLENALALIRNSKEKLGKTVWILSTLDIRQEKILPLAAGRLDREAAALWNQGVRELGGIVFDLEELVKEVGRERFYSRKMWYLGSIPFSSAGEERIATGLARLWRAYQGKRKKALAIDLDNTLWGGVVGEEGIDGITLSTEKEGKAFHDFQKRILDLKRMGVMLTLVSKNNPEDALEVFRKHPAMVLQVEDFVSMKINWDPKPQNIATLAKELNVGLDSFIMIDDSPFERQAVKEILPEVVAPDFPKDTSKLSDWIRELASEYFLFLETTEEDAQRTQMMRADISRKQVQQQFQDLDHYLSSLNMTIDIHLARDEDVPRIAQLTQKTNQFNVTTRRYTEADILRMKEDPAYRLWIGSVEDRFGDYGKVVLLIARVEDNEADYDTFLMSCRVMERHVEDAAISWIESQLGMEGVERVRAHYLPTPKNKPVEGLWQRLGYSTLDGADNFERDLRTPLPASAIRKAHVKIKGQKSAVDLSEENA